MRIVLHNCNLADAERVLILVALAEMGDLEGAAELCGVTWARLRHLLRVHGIEWPGVGGRRRRQRRAPRGSD
ncbi:MAG TPA: hypothetical protein VGB85_33660 [Nannocystis sp.]|jgi:hypothetical protein